MPSTCCNAGIIAIELRRSAADFAGIGPATFASSTLCRIRVLLARLGVAS